MTARSPKGRRRTATAPAPSEDLANVGTTHRHPPLGLGLWALGRWTREDEQRTRATIERALDRGIRWFDTAEVYGSGRSERILGDALARRGSAARGVFLSTKLSWEHLRPTQVRPALQGSLTRLGLPRVDLYLVHAPDPHVPIAETMGALESLWKEGKVGAIGVSNFSVDELTAARRALVEAPLVANQVRYNLLEREEGDALLPYCRANGVVLEAYTPLARGLLAGRYLDAERPDPRARSFARDLFDRDRFAEFRERALALRALAKEAAVPMASLALHFLARQGAAVVFGASRPEQVDDALSAWSHRPDDATLDRAEAIARGTRA